MSSRALPIAVLVFSMVFFWALAAFAFSGGSLTDPAEILTRGAQATANADSFHLSLAVEGSMADSNSGAPASLDGVTVEGDVDVAGKAAQVSFALPMLFGLTGEAIVVGEDVYLLTPMAGDQWLHFAATPDEGDEPAGEPPTDEEIADKVNELLRRMASGSPCSPTSPAGTTPATTSRCPSRPRRSRPTATRCPRWVTRWVALIADARVQWTGRRGPPVPAERPLAPLRDRGVGG